MKILTREEMRELDRQAIEERGIPEKTLIQHAGKAVADWFVRHYPDRRTQVGVVIGKGNNGADARVAAGLIKKMKYRVQCWDATLSPHSKGKRGWKPMKDFSRDACFIDGIFGTGLNREVKGTQREWIEYLIRQKGAVISLDIPSGMDANTGHPLGICVRATHTLTFGCAKWGLLQETSANDVGRVHLLDIGFPDDLLDSFPSPFQLITSDVCQPFFHPRPRNAHKGLFGHVLILGGSKGLQGAPVLSSLAAIRTGAGLVSCGVPSDIHIISAILSGPEVMTFSATDPGSPGMDVTSMNHVQKLLGRADAIVLGPGLGHEKGTADFLEKMIHIAKVPMVLDADALNILSLRKELLKQCKGRVILTPHVGEMARLVGCSNQDVIEHRMQIAGEFVLEHDVVLILKGARTLVVWKSGKGCEFAVNGLAGGPGMAVGGSGDALSGVIGALLARRAESLSAAAMAGVWIHASAGDLAMPESGGGKVTELIDAIPEVIEGIQL